MMAQTKQSSKLSGLTMIRSDLVARLCCYLLLCTTGLASGATITIQNNNNNNQVGPTSSPFVAAAATAAAAAALGGALDGNNLAIKTTASPLAPSKINPPAGAATTSAPHKHGNKKISSTDKLHKFDLFVDPVCEQIVKLTDKQLKKVYVQLKQFSHLSNQGLAKCFGDHGFHVDLQQQPPKAHALNRDNLANFCTARSASNEPYKQFSSCAQRLWSPAIDDELDKILKDRLEGNKAASKNGKTGLGATETSLVDDIVAHLHDEQVQEIAKELAKEQQHMVKTGKEIISSALSSGIIKVQVQQQSPPPPSSPPFSPTNSNSLSKSIHVISANNKPLVSFASTAPPTPKLIVINQNTNNKNAGNNNNNNLLPILTGNNNLQITVNPTTAAPKLPATISKGQLADILHNQKPIVVDIVDKKPAAPTSPRPIIIINDRRTLPVISTTAKPPIELIVKQPAAQANLVGLVPNNNNNNNNNNNLNNNKNNFNDFIVTNKPNLVQQPPPAVISTSRPTGSPVPVAGPPLPLTSTTTTTTTTVVSAPINVAPPQPVVGPPPAQNANPPLPAAAPAAAQPAPVPANAPLAANAPPAANAPVAPPGPPASPAGLGPANPPMGPLIGPNSSITIVNNNPAPTTVPTVSPLANMLLKSIQLTTVRPLTTAGPPMVPSGSAPAPQPPTAAGLAPLPPPPPPASNAPVGFNNSPGLLSVNDQAQLNVAPTTPAPKSIDVIINPTVAPVVPVAQIPAPPVNNALTVVPLNAPPKSTFGPDPGVDAPPRVAVAVAAAPPVALVEPSVIKNVDKALAIMSDSSHKNGTIIQSGSNEGNKTIAVVMTSAASSTTTTTGKPNVAASTTSSKPTTTSSTTTKPITTTTTSTTKKPASTTTTVKPIAVISLSGASTPKITENQQSGATISIVGSSKDDKHSSSTSANDKTTPKPAELSATTTKAPAKTNTTTAKPSPSVSAIAHVVDNEHDLMKLRDKFGAANVHEVIVVGDHVEGDDLNHDYEDHSDHHEKASKTSHSTTAPPKTNQSIVVKVDEHDHGHEHSHGHADGHDKLTVDHSKKSPASGDKKHDEHSDHEHLLEGLLSGDVIHVEAGELEKGGE